MRIGISAPFNPSCVKDYLPGVDAPFINNGATSINTLVLALLQEGHYVIVFTISNDVLELEHLKGKNIEVYLIPTIISSKIGWFKHHLLLDSFYVHKRLTKAIRMAIDDLDVLHAHWTYDFALACLPFIKEKPLFVSVRDWAPMQILVQRRLVDKIVWWLKMRKFRKVMGNDKICYIANSVFTLNMILSEYPKSQTSLIPNPFNRSLVNHNRTNLSVNHKFITIAQDLDDKGKNLDPLVRAFAMLKKEHAQAELHLVGSIDKQGCNYRSWECENLLGGTFFHGIMNHNEILTLMDSMSCLVHPSLLETFGNVLLEGMARGLVCIGGGNSGAVPYVLGQGKCGVLCDVKNVGSLYSAMKETMVFSKRRTLIENADKMMNDNYMSDIVAKKHVALYKSFLNK